MTRVLIVDDEKSIRRTLGEFLRAEGYEAVEAEDAEAAQRCLGEAGFDVVVTDIVLPRVSGVELLHRIQALAPDVPVVMMTGEPTVETATESLRAGAVDYLFKPITKAAILRVVTNAARLKSLTDAKRALEAENQAYRESLERLVEARTQQLQLSEERFRSMVETAFDWVWEVDAEGRYTYVSPRVRDLLGYTPQEVLGRTPFEFMPEAEAKRLSAKFHKLIARREAFSALQNINCHKNGRHVILETSGVPILDRDGTFKGYRGMDRDITDRTRLEEQLRQAQKLEAIGQLAGGVAHDFNNILAAIIMQHGLLQRNPALDAQTRAALKDLDQDTRTAANLTRQLLMFSRRAVMMREPIDLNRAVDSMLKMLRRLIGEHMTLELVGAATLPLVEADASMMDQVVMNLVVNARDAMPQGGKITIATTVVDFDEAQIPPGSNRQAGRFVVLRVSDTGKGMDRATLHRIFEPFFTTKETGKGTGLGLATVHGIVAQHRGWVEVESEVGLGTTFRIYLPVFEGVQVQEAPESQQPTGVKGKETILVVEDQLNVRRLITETLREHGYAVHQAANGHEAVALWQKHGPQIDLLFTDMVMPEGMTGLELAERLRALKPSLKVIISSGYSAEFNGVNTIGEAGIQRLPKPYESGQLLEKVRSCLDQGEE